MKGALGLIPVPFDQGGVGVVLSKQAVPDAGHPHVTLVGLPGFHWLCAGDHSGPGHLGAVSDPAGIALTAVLGVDPFPVHTGQHNDFIPGHGHLGRLLDGLIGCSLGAVPTAFHAG